MSKFIRDSDGDIWQQRATGGPTRDPEDWVYFPAHSPGSSRIAAWEIEQEYGPLEHFDTYEDAVSDGSDYDEIYSDGAVPTRNDPDEVRSGLEEKGWADFSSPEITKSFIDQAVYGTSYLKVDENGMKALDPRTVNIDDSGLDFEKMVWNHVGYATPKVDDEGRVTPVNPYDPVANPIRIRLPNKLTVSKKDIELNEPSEMESVVAGALSQHYPLPGDFPGDEWPYEEVEMETRVTDPDTGGQKGSKLAQLGAIEPRALMEVAKVAGHGAQKYERLNFLKGYSWSLSYDALQRHLMQFWAGEDRDEESKQYHLAHAAWHCLAMLAFMILDRGTDDRPIRSIEEGD